MVDQCSIWAYQEILDSGRLGKIQAIFLSIFSSSGQPLTAAEAVEKFKEFNGSIQRKTSVYGIGPRLSELEAMGFLEKFDIVKCHSTNKRVNRWRYTGRKIPKIKSVKRICCPRCDGKGIVDVFEYLDL